MHRVTASHLGAMLALAVASCAISLVCSAQSTFPTKPIRYIVPFGPGGSPDIIGRVLGERLSRLWGQQVIVENRAGVAGMLGTSVVAKSPPDGYTLIQCNIASSAIGMSLYAKPLYDQMRDIAAVTRIGTTSNILTVHPSVPFRSVQDLIAYARANPNKLSYAAGPAGTSPQLSMELIKLTTKIDVVHISYKIGAQAISDNIAGQVPTGFFNLQAPIAPVQSGRLRALAITGPKRTPQLPSTPTLIESGLPLEITSWQGVCAPAATPTAVLDKLNADIASVLRVPEVQHRLSEFAVEAAPNSREEFDQFIRSEIARWGQVIKDAKIPLQ